MVELSKGNSGDESEGVTLEKIPGSGFHTQNGFAGILYKRTDTGEQVYVTFRKRNNMYGKTQSYALSVDIIEDLQSQNIETLFIFEDYSTLYEIPLSEYVESDEELDYNGYDKQKAPSITKSSETYQAVRVEDTYSDTITF
jgi:hypothetical protein